MFGADTFCTRIGNQDRPRATRTGIVAKDEPRQEENLGPGNLFLLTGGGHIEVRWQIFFLTTYFLSIDKVNIICQSPDQPKKHLFRSTFLGTELQDRCISRPELNSFVI